MYTLSNTIIRQGDVDAQMFSRSVSPYQPSLSRRDAMILEREIQEIVARAVDESTDESGAIDFKGLLGTAGKKIGSFVAKHGAEFAGNAVGSFFGSKGNDNSNPAPPQVVTVTSAPPAATSGAPAPPAARDFEDIQAIVARAAQGSTDESGALNLGKAISGLVGLAGDIFGRDENVLQARRPTDELFSRDVEEMIAREFVSTLVTRAYQEATKR